MSADDLQIVPLSNEKIASDRSAAAKAPAPAVELYAGDDAQPPSTLFNTMKDRLESALKEIKPERKTIDKSTAPDDSDKIRTDSRAKPTDAQKAEIADDLESKTITTAKAADWKALKDKRDSAEKSAKDLQQKLEMTSKEYEEFKKHAIPSSELEKVRMETKTALEERQKLQEQIDIIALERSPRFNEYFTKKFSDLTNRVKESVGSDHAEKAEQLLNLPSSAWRKERLGEIREELDGMDQGQFDIAIAAYDDVRRDRDEQLKNYKVNYQRLTELERQQAESQKIESSKQSERNAERVLEVARKTALSFTPGEDANHNLFVKESEDYLSKFFRKELSDTEVALLPVYVREAKRLSENVVPAMEKKIQELEAALNNYKGSSPNPGTSGRGAAPASASTASSFIEKFNEHWPGGNR